MVERLDAVGLHPNSHKLKPQLATNQRCSALQAFNSDVALCFQDAIDLSAARAHT